MRSNKNQVWIYILVTLVLFGVFKFTGEQDGAVSDEEWVKVDRVIDGDTFWAVFADGKRDKVRLIGIDAPEVRDSRYKERGDYAEEATQFLKSMIDGKSIRLTYDVGKYDRYKRVLAYAYLENGAFINADLVENGYATVLTIPPNVTYADKFVKLERKARKNKVGLWGKL